MSRASNLQYRIRLLGNKLRSLQNEIRLRETNITFLQSEYVRISKQWYRPFKGNKLTKLSELIADEQHNLTQARQNSDHLIELCTTLENRFIWANTADIGEILSRTGFRFGSAYLNKRIDSIITMIDNVLENPSDVLHDPKIWVELIDGIADLSGILNIILNGIRFFGGGEED